MSASVHDCSTHPREVMHVLPTTGPGGEAGEIELFPSIWAAYKRRDPGYPHGDSSRITVRELSSLEAQYDTMRNRFRGLALNHPGSVGAPPDWEVWLRQARASDIANGIVR